MKQEVTQLKDSMFQIVNSEDASGQALFAGYKVNKMPSPKMRMDIFNTWAIEEITLLISQKI